ncbi:MAG TPA: hypothetical protein ACFCUC_10980 [Desulfobacterales bacterium]
MQPINIQNRIQRLMTGLREDEQRVYRRATTDFSRNRTYQITPEPLRSALQHDFGAIQVERYIKKKKSSRSYALDRDDESR